MGEGIQVVPVRTGRDGRGGGGGIQVVCTYVKVQFSTCDYSPPP